MEYILITNDPGTAAHAEQCGVNRVLVDLEILGKAERQGDLDTLISGHSISDIEGVRKVLEKAKLVVRVNPIHSGSAQEIGKVLCYEPDVLMLPMFTSSDEVQKFVDLVDGRAAVNLLLETPQALVRLDEIIRIDGVSEVHVGLNDLHLAMKLDFMFELLSGGVVEYVAGRVRSLRRKFGFGGISRLGDGDLDSSLILSEHCRLGSEMVILSRQFRHSGSCGGDYHYDLGCELRRLRERWEMLCGCSPEELQETRDMLVERVRTVVKGGQVASKSS